MSDDSKDHADLSGLGLDLTEMFRPSWTKEAGQTADASRLAASFGDEGGDRPRRAGRGPGREERHGRDRGPRSGSSGGERDRGPRRESRGQGPGGREGGRRGERGPSRHDEGDRRAQEAPVSVLEGWKLELVPEPSAVEGIAKQVRSRAKAYPLFELSRLILKLSDRYSVKLAPLTGETPALFRAKLDGSLWNTRREAVDHLLSEHLGKFYRRSTVATEPPKGAFSVVAQCGMSGVLLGPPNHHEYTSKVIALHASRFRTMPFEAFKSRIRMMRDEALLERWKTEQSTRTVYTPFIPGEDPSPDAPVVAEQSAAEAPGAGGTAEVPQEASAVADETPVAGESVGEGVPEPGTEAAPSETGETLAGEEPASESAGEAASSPQGFSFAEITADFLTNHADNEIEQVSGEITLSGRAALHGSTKLLRELLLRHLRETDRFPLPLAQSVGKQLTSQGLQLFKSHKKIIHVSMARPRHLDRSATPIGDNFRSILEYLEAHPNQRRDKQWAALLALRTGVARGTEDGARHPGALPDAPVAAETAQSAEPPREEIAKHEQALGADLLWLLHQGHVIDFAMGNLQAATPPKPQPPKKEKGGQAPADATRSGETVPGNPSSESCEGSEESDTPGVETVESGA
jgi:hypothetical protein